jgi:hypothetical protein
LWAWASGWLFRTRDDKGEIETEMSEAIKSWAQALAQNALSPEQRAVLETMVRDGQAESLAAAAAMLDWQETVIHPDEHMYGF